MVLKKLGNIQFDRDCCKLIEVFNAVGLNRPFLQHFQFFLNILDILDHDYSVDFHFYFSFRKQLLHNGKRKIEIFFAGHCLGGVGHLLIIMWIKVHYN